MAAGTTILMMYAGCFGLVGFVALTGTALYLWGRRHDRHHAKGRRRRPDADEGGVEGVG